MEFEGKVWKSRKSRYWIAYIEMFDLSTQGTSKANALDMVKDAIESLVHKNGFKVSVTQRKDSVFTVGANDLTVWMGFLLQRLRMKQGLTVEGVARRMGFSSKTAYARYEQGRVTPSLSKFIQILEAVSPCKKAVFRFAA